MVFREPMTRGVLVGAAGKKSVIWRPHAANPRIIDPEVLADLVERVTFHMPRTAFCVLRAKARGHRDLVTVRRARRHHLRRRVDHRVGRMTNARARPAVQGTLPHPHACVRSTGLKISGLGNDPGIGPVYAKKKRRCEASGEKVFDIIEAEPDRLREVTGIGAVRAKRITDAWVEQKVVREIMSSFTAMALEPPVLFASTRPMAPTPSSHDENPYRLARGTFEHGLRPRTRSR